MRIQPRKGNGRYKHSSWHNFKKKKRGWKEYAWHPFTAATFALLAYLTMGIAQAIEEYKHLDGKIEIFNADFTKFREPLKINQDTDDAEGETGETASRIAGTPTTSPVSGVEAVSDSATSEEGQTPSKVTSPSSIEAKILKAWDGTGNGRVAIDVFKCESWRDGRYQIDVVGDRELAFEYNGQLYGRSIGIAQIRTGGIERNGRIWVASNNVAEFEEKMKNPDENLKMARAKYDASVKANGNGWYPWKNCAKRVGLIQE